MNTEILLAILLKKMEERFNSLHESTRLRGPRGQRGSPGKDGKDFSLEETKPLLSELVKEHSLKFSDLTVDEIAQLRGPQGRTGRDGKDGKDFSLEENKEYFENLAKEFALKFENLSEDQILKLKGPQGRDGKDGRNGRDFEFSKHKEDIEVLIKDLILDLQDSLKLKFSDLTSDEISQLRGPQGRTGRDGKDGKDFSLEENKEYFENLAKEFALKFNDLTDEEKDSLKLKFNDLTDEEKDSLKLKFNDLTDEERISLKGPRGARGQKGRDGIDGRDGKDFNLAEHYTYFETLSKKFSLKFKDLTPDQIKSLTGKDGINGRDGRNGKDASEIEEIEVDQIKSDEISFKFIFSDGTYIETNSIKLPKGPPGMGGGGGGGGGSGSGSGTQGPPGKSAYEIAVENGFIGTETDWLESLKGEDGPVGPQGPQGPQGPSGGSSILTNIPCDESVFVGSAVRLLKEDQQDTVMSDWSSLLFLTKMNYTTYETLAVNSLASGITTGFVTGIVINKPTTITCDIQLSGETPELYYSLDVGVEYYLSADFEGSIVPSNEAPKNIGEIYLRIGRATSNKKLLIDLGERVLIS